MITMIVSSMAVVIFILAYMIYILKKDKIEPEKSPLKLSSKKYEA